MGMSSAEGCLSLVVRPIVLVAAAIAAECWQLKSRLADVERATWRQLPTGCRCAPCSEQGCSDQAFSQDRLQASGTLRKVEPGGSCPQPPGGCPGAAEA